MGRLFTFSHTYPTPRPPVISMLAGKRDYLRQMNASTGILYVDKKNCALQKIVRCIVR